MKKTEVTIMPYCYKYKKPHHPQPKSDISFGLNLASMKTSCHCARPRNKKVSF